MALTWRRRLRRTVLCTAIAVQMSLMTFGVRADDGEVVSMPRVRASTPIIASLLAEASTRSATFRTLVSSIEHTDGIVYVEPGRCNHGVRACLSLSITTAGGFRILRVLVNLATDVLELMATIGHELQHALEILAEPKVKTAHQAYLFYAREAATSRDVFETRAAIQAGYDVRDEIGRYRPR